MTDNPCSIPRYPICGPAGAPQTAPRPPDTGQAVSAAPGAAQQPDRAQALDRIRAYVEHAPDGYVRPERSTGNPVRKSDLEVLLAEVSPGWEGSGFVTVPLDALRRALAGGSGHSHSTPEVWDADNGEHAGQPCTWCPQYAELVRLAGGPGALPSRWNQP